jgi:hypothetical protein
MKLPLLIATACALTTTALAQTVTNPAITRAPQSPPALTAPQPDPREERATSPLRRLPEETRNCADAAAIERGRAEAARRHEQNMAAAAAQIQMGIVTGAVQVAGQITPSTETAPNADRAQSRLPQTATSAPNKPPPAAPLPRCSSN